MVVNGSALLRLAPIKNMSQIKYPTGNVTAGLGEAGYDIRIKQEVKFFPRGNEWNEPNRFVLASAIEEFQMPSNLMGIVHDKSSWARKGLSVFNTVIEPGWHGFLTLELVYHGQEDLVIPAGSGIAQVVFHETAEARYYTGRYQNQADRPVEAISIT